jgi:hypothetical protein
MHLHTKEIVLYAIHQKFDWGMKGPEELAPVVLRSVHNEGKTRHQMGKTSVRVIRTDPEHR